MRPRIILPIILCSMIGLSVHAQIAVDPHRYQWWSHSYTTGSHTNSSTQPREVDAHLVHVPGAVSVRVFFAQVNLGDPEDYIEVQSVQDGHLQRLYPHELTKWQDTSAYFNGSSVWVRLVLAPGSTGRYLIEQVIGGVGALPGDASICGATDDRCLSTDWRSMRAVSNPTGSSGGCTIWTASPTDCVLSAGHCTGTFGVAEAEVPLSTSSGGAQHPAPNRQWPITPLQSTNGGVGNDWAISTLAPNAQGELPAQLYGWHNLGFYIPTVNSTIRVTGYGSTGSSSNLSCAPMGMNPLLWDIVNKTHTGPFVTTTNGTGLRYAMDTTGGNSGSPVIDETTGMAVGIHTHAGCNSSGGSNQGTSLTLPAFVNAWNQTCAPPQVPTAQFTTSATSVVTGTSVSFSDNSLGIPDTWAWDLDGDGNTDSTSQNPTFFYNQAGTFDVSLTVTNSLGTDTITMPGLVTVSAVMAQSLPYSEDFSSGLPQQGAGGWSFTSSNSFGRIRTFITGNASPASGGDALAMDSNTNGNFVTNDASLFVDAAATGGGILTYWIKETSDEDHPEDGLWLSDGTTEVLVRAHIGSFGSWAQETVDLAATAATFGLSLTNNFRITWRQRDNFGAPTDGHFIDDINITGGFTCDFSSTAGDLFLRFTSIPAGTVEGFTLMSFQTVGAPGSGSFFGLSFDSLTQFCVQQPIAPGGLFHWSYPAGGLFPDADYTLPPGSLLGFAGVDIDVCGVALAPGLVINGVTDVVRETF